VICGPVYDEWIVLIVEARNGYLAAETFHYMIYANIIETCCCHERRRDSRFWIENECMFANVKHVEVSPFFPNTETDNQQQPHGL